MFWACLGDLKTNMHHEKIIMGEYNVNLHIRLLVTHEIIMGEYNVNLHIRLLVTHFMKRISKSFQEPKVTSFLILNEK